MSTYAYGQSISPAAQQRIDDLTRQLAALRARHEALGRTVRELRTENRDLRAQAVSRTPLVITHTVRDDQHDMLEAEALRIRRLWNEPAGTGAARLAALGQELAAHARKDAA